MNQLRVGKPHLACWQPYRWPDVRNDDARGIKHNHVPDTDGVSISDKQG